MAGDEVPRGNPVEPGPDAEGGDPACWAGLVCQECGAVVSEGHRPGCRTAGIQSLAPTPPPPSPPPASGR